MKKPVLGHVSTNFPNHIHVITRRSKLVRLLDVMHDVMPRKSFSIQQLTGGEIMISPINTADRQVFFDALNPIYKQGLLANY